MRTLIAPISPLPPEKKTLLRVSFFKNFMLYAPFTNPRYPRILSSLLSCKPIISPPSLFPSQFVSIESETKALPKLCKVLSQHSPFCIVPKGSTLTLLHHPQGVKSYLPQLHHLHVLTSNPSSLSIFHPSPTSPSNSNTPNSSWNPQL